MPLAEFGVCVRVCVGGGWSKNLISFRQPLCIIFMGAKSLEEKILVWMIFFYRKYIYFYLKF